MQNPPVPKPESMKKGDRLQNKYKCWCW